MSKRAVEDFVNLYELLLLAGAPVAVAKAKVCELYSPPRVAAEAARWPRLGPVPGSTFDLQEDAHGARWDFLKASDRQRARQQIEAERPFLVVGSPPCTRFSALMRINRSRMNSQEYARRLVEARVLLGIA